jgi:hypothetical protein
VEWDGDAYRFDLGQVRLVIGMPATSRSILNPWSQSPENGGSLVLIARYFGARYFEDCVPVGNIPQCE